MGKQFFKKMLEFFPNSEIEYNNIVEEYGEILETCLLYTSPSPRDTR